jgi:type IV secretory pathway VirB2 component (pilin)
MNRFFSVLMSLVVVMVMSFGLSASFTQPVAAQKDAACEAIGGCEETDGSSVNRLIATILNILSFIAGVAAVIMIIIAGFKFITSQGDSSAVTSARNTALYAVVGIIIVVLAQVIVRFVLTQATTPTT